MAQFMLQKVVIYIVLLERKCSTYSYFLCFYGRKQEDISLSDLRHKTTGTWLELNLKKYRIKES